MPVQLFSGSEYRRKLCGRITDEEWFDVTNEEVKAMRRACNEAVIVDILAFLDKHVNGVVILDSTNPDHSRRINLLTKIKAETGAKVMFIEVINEDVAFLERQYEQRSSRLQELSLSKPDSNELAHGTTVSEYRKKVDLAKNSYEPLDEGPTHATEYKFSYMKCDHANQHFVVRNVKGYLMQKVVNFIMNLRTTQHSFYLSRHGQSEYNNLGRIGGDSSLAFHGVKYAEKLAEFVETKITKDANGNDRPARLWTSTMKRTKETAQFIKHPTLVIKPDPEDPSLDFEWIQMRPKIWHHLDELFAGSCDGMTYEEIEEKYPEEWGRRNTDKLAYRYPRGESYLDVIARLEPIIIEMESSQEPLLIIAHQGILRIIYAFYKNLSRTEAPYISIPLNEVIELNPGAVLCTEKRYALYTPPVHLCSDGQDETTIDPPSH